MHHPLRWLAIALALFVANAQADSSVPAAPRVSASTWLLADFDSGARLAAHDAGRRVAPASLTKLMTAYLLFEKLRSGKWMLGEQVNVSPRAAAQRGARIFLVPGQSVPAETLLQGMIVRSANDATLALVEHVAENERAFVVEMNHKADEFGLHGTHFVNATGLDAAGHYSTANDLLILASRLLRDFPEQYRRFAVREFAYQELKQYNRNALLWRDSSVDGIKTGRTQQAGFCLIASANRNGMRLIAVVLGAADEAGRVSASEQLLDYGFRHFETRLVMQGGEPATRVRVWMGEASELPLGLERPLFVTLPRGQHAQLHTRFDVGQLLTAPIAAGERVGFLGVALGDKPIAQVPLIALRAVDTGNILQRAFDRIQLWAQ
jgi:D-alanyl-D-alanine carboxypeptidase (penicillin-binding protein 5/6)